MLVLGGSPVIKGACALDLTQVLHHLRIQGLRGLQKPWQVRACHCRAGLGQSEESGFSSSSLGKGCGELHRAEGVKGCGWSLLGC